MAMTTTGQKVVSLVDFVLGSVHVGYLTTFASSLAFSLNMRLRCWMRPSRLD